MYFFGTFSVHFLYFFWYFFWYIFCTFFVHFLYFFWYFFWYFFCTIFVHFLCTFWYIFCTFLGFAGGSVRVRVRDPLLLRGAGVRRTTTAVRRLRTTLLRGGGRRTIYTTYHNWSPSTFTVLLLREWTVTTKRSTVNCYNIYIYIFSHGAYHRCEPVHSSWSFSWHFCCCCLLACTWNVKSVVPVLCAHRHDEAIY